MRFEADEIELAAADAIGLARNVTLPVVAASRSRDAILSRYQTRLALLAVLVTVGVLFMVAVALQQRSETRNDMLVFILFFALIVGGTCFVLAQRMLRAPRAYRDPGLAIEVGADGIAISAPAGRQDLGWDEVEAEITLVRFRGTVHFEGLELDSRFGTQKLNDIWYSDGRTAAAAIVRGVEQARQARERAKVERIG